ncbi:ATP-dependent Clp protease proteolytic subunit [Undibacterium sp. Di27W]|uniref:ATP-dependent Clp protease proteolytic subunit n=1 Tax=Undibacterium sp. Di27W TaxID=3413036 RepID=UPI003BF2FF03
MIKLMRFINLLLLVLLGLGAFYSFFTAHYTGNAEMYAGMFGIVLVMSFYFFPWLALSDHSSKNRLRLAWLFSWLYAFVAVGSAIGISMSHTRMEWHVVLPIVLAYVLPWVLNLLAFKKKKLELEARTTDAALTDSTKDDWSKPVENSFAPKANYLLAHWRGNLPLGKSSWLNGVFLGHVLVTVVAMSLTKLMEKRGASLRALAICMIIFLSLATLAWFWAVVGMARAASKHKSRGGSILATLLAQVFVVASVVVVVFRVVNFNLPQLQEFILIASGHDSMSRVNISASVQGDTLSLKGQLGEGSSVYFAEFLEKTPHTKTIILNSSGGRLLEARKIASIIKARQFNTYVEDLCASACTYIFLAGTDRAATPNARIGFHQPSFPGITGRDLDTATQAMLDEYRQAQLPEPFIQKIGATESAGMWYPTREELLAAGVITRTTLGGESSINLFSEMNSRDDILKALRDASIWRIYEQRQPGKLEEIADLLWKMKQQGASQQSLQNAVQPMIAREYTSALKDGPASYLDAYASLLIEELLAAKDISPIACASLIKGELNIYRTLPPPLPKKHRELMEKVLLNNEHGKSYTMQSKEFNTAAPKLMAFMTPLHKRVTEDLQAYQKQPELQCEAVIALYRNILRLNEKDRYVVLSGLVQAR